MYKRCIAFMLTLCILIAGLPGYNLRAATSDDTLYTEMFSTETAAYYMTCQPKSAIILNSSVTLDKDMLSPNYRGGIIDLPRLQVGYFYTVSGNFRLLDTMYPTLGWDEAAIGTSATLSIRSQDTKKTMKTVTIKVPSDSKLHGMDYWYPAEDTEVVADIASADSRWATDCVWSGRKITKKTWKDCSDSVVRDLVSNGMSQYAGNFALYDTAMHRDSIVMNTYVYCADSANTYDCLSGKTPTAVDITDVAYDLSRYDIFEDTTVETQVKDYLGTLNNGEVRPGLLFYGSKTNGCEFNPTEGTSVTKLEVGNSDTLYYFIALSKKCYFYRMDTSVTSDVVSEIDETAPKMSWEANMYYNLQTENSYSDAGFIESSTNMHYGPLNFDKCLNDAGENYVRDGKYGVTHTYLKSQNNINLYAESLLYPGCVPHFANVEIKAAQYQVTLNYYIKQPNTSSYALLFSTPQIYNAAIFKDAVLAEMPEVENYQARCWFTDQALKNRFDKASVPTTQNKTISLYGDYMYVGGTYNVRFYDERTKYDKSFTMQADKKPTLPPTLTDSTGWFFKEWIIVNDISETEGQSYDAETFMPVANSDYVFKAVWTNKGGISKIETTKKDYVIGEKLDPATVKITVVDDNGEHVATVDEFTLDNVDLNVAGTITITATLKASGVKGTFTVNVSDIEATSISATYKGGSVYIGREIQPADIEVTVFYNNGSSNKTTDFTVSPATILQEGVNTIDIYYLDLKSAVTITGIPYDEESENETELVELDADCTLDYIYMKDELRPEDMVVIAIYDDGSEVTLTPEQFTISPTTFTTPGINQVTVTYGGMTYTIDVAVRSKDSADTTGVGNYTVLDPSKGDASSAYRDVLGGLYGTGKDIVVTKPNKKKEPTKKPDTTQKKPDTTQKKPEQTTRPTTQEKTTGTSTGNSTHNYALNGNTPGASGNQNRVDMGTGETSNPSSTGSNGSSTSGSGDSPTDGGDGNYDDHDDGSGFNGGDAPTVDDNVSDKRSTEASVGYLDGATILTNTMGLSGLQTVSVDISNMVKHARKNSDVYIELPNGNNNNILTPDILGAIKRRNLTVHLSMVKPTDLNTAVANWTIVGRKIDTSSTNLNPNVTFEVTDKSSDRLVYFAIADGTYPEGCSLTIVPEANCYKSGELCRLYSCDINKGSSSVTSTIVWQDGNNSFSYDVYGGHSYCLSNSPNAYPEGASLLDINGMPSSVPGDQQTAGGDDVIDQNGDSFIDDTNIDDGIDANSSLGKKLRTVGIVIGCVVLVTLAIALIFTLLFKLLGKRNNSAIPAEDSPDDVGSVRQVQSEEDLNNISFDTLSDRGDSNT